MSKSVSCQQEKVGAEEKHFFCVRSPIGGRVRPWTGTSGEVLVYRGHQRGSTIKRRTRPWTDAVIHGRTYSPMDGVGLSMGGILPSAACNIPLIFACARKEN